jgi:preprotein translocase subunit SecD
MRRRLWTTFAIIALLIGLAGFISWPTTTNFLGRDVSLRQGLDLKGGSYLVYELRTDRIDSSEVQDAIEGVRTVFEGRVNTLGVSEPDIRVGTAGSKPTLMVSLPGIQNLSQARALLGNTGTLAIDDETGKTVLEGKDIVSSKTLAEPATTTTGGLAGRGLWQVRLTMTEEGKDKFAKATAENIGKSLTIFIDNLAVSNPTVNSAITDGVAIISGNFSSAAAQELALQLKSGALPVPVTLIQEQTIGASLGQDAIQASAIAGLIAIALVMVFMIAYYRWLGVIASLSLIAYSVINVMVFKLLPVTMSLAGIAGFIISIGAAVDTNILTFERLKEELRLGKALPVAIKESFRRSWTSIRDSHIAGIITSLIIFSFGSGGVRGFALVLLIGTLLSLFSAITITRNWMLLIAGSKLGRLLHVTK